MMKRKGGSFEEEHEAKRLHSEEEEGMPEGATLVIQQEDGQYATIVHNSEDFDLQGVTDEGQMMIHIPEDQMLSHDGTVVITSDQIISSEQVGEEQVLDQNHMTVMGDIMDDDEQHIKVEHLTVEQLAEAEDATGALAIPEAEGEAGELLPYQNLIIQHMDISEPLSKLRKLLEARLQTSLAQHEFWLQDTIALEPSKNLVSQCVQGSGMVQINVEVKSQSGTGLSPRLNIVDILKPAEEIVEMEAAAEAAPKPTPTPAPSTTKVVIPFPEESENVTRWIVDQTFRKDQERLKIPFDPQQWNIAHVKHWLQWSIKEFNLANVNLTGFNLTGQQLCNLRHDQFVKYIPNDKGDLFWTHLELLRKCKFVAVIQQPTPHAITTITVSTSDTAAKGRNKGFIRKPRSITIPSDRVHPGNRSGNNGQIQLWQFLLELLTDKHFRDIIHWLGEEGEFKLSNPEMVAQLWGQRKNKPSMNYEKLSRALRYYYDGDMIAKVHGKRFVYKFVCDLRTLLGYSAGELSRLVAECAAKKKINPDIETFASAQAISSFSNPQTLSPLTLATSLQQLSSSSMTTIPSISSISSITGVQPAILKKVFIKQ